MSSSPLAARTEAFDSSGIRKVFDLAARLEDPINLSIGQPDFAVPAAVQEAAVDAIRSGRNGYTVTQGIAPLRQRLQERVDQQWGHPDRQVLITSGTSGGLVLAVLALIDPGDEVIVFDPYFVMYEPLVSLAGGRCVMVETYPDFRIDPDKVRAALSEKTKLILCNSPANPTGVVATAEEVRGLAQLAAESGVVLLSDEIYSLFHYDGELVSPAMFNEQTLVLDGFSKSHAITGWRLGYAHGPSEIIEAMTKLQQFTFVCAPQPAQWAGLVALDVDMSAVRDAYRRKRDLLVEGLADNFQIADPGGAFYVFPRAPWGTGSEFVARAIEHNLLIIPGHVFSQRDSHFRLSYAAADEQIERGIEVLNRLAREGP
ncbi:MAG: aminotransferase class I/II-fold pyridoxal phosphate-dependent enzyme [Planctomycetales bacterium]|nr:aminotransferase class I/II-fold pyridoxal phosphate-dependent enzyme [Planctomycetales bacterium]